MGSQKKTNAFPKWAPSDLVQHSEELRPKAEEEGKRNRTSKLRIVDKRADAENRQLHIGLYFVGHGTQYMIAKALLTSPGMESVWRNLQRRTASFKPALSVSGGMTPACNLHGACVEAEIRWINLPKLTRTESRKLHRTIAQLSLQLAELLLQVESRDLLDIRKFIDKEHEKDFIKALEKGGYEFAGFDVYVDHLLGELLEPIPGVLLKLRKRALEHAEFPLVVSQPNSPNAKINFFIQEMSKYFLHAYGQPLHAHVAAVVSAILHADVDEDRVRALLRARKAARKRRTRKKIAELSQEIDG